MPMNGGEMLGSNSDGSKNEDYCMYCYKNGKFVADVDMDMMIHFCVPHMVRANPGMSDEEAKSKMQEFFPKLKRWAK